MPEHRRHDPSIERSCLNVETWPLDRILDLVPAWGGDTWDQVIDSALEPMRGTTAGGRR